MNNNLLLKCLIAFFIGIIVYKFISDRCSSNIVEGQCDGEADGRNCIRSGISSPISVEDSSGNTQEIDCSVADVETYCSNTCVSGDSESLPLECRCCMWSNINLETSETVERTSVNLQPINKVISELNIYFDSESTDSLPQELTGLLNRFAEISGTQQNEEILNNISSLSDIGNSANTETLDYIELIVRNILEVDNQILKRRISTSFFEENDTICSQDIYLNIMTFMVLIHNNIITKDEFVNVINISDRLSKYIPKLFNKLEELYEDCPKNSNSSNYYKSLILSSVFNKLFKNNTTVINVKGFSNLMESLENVKTIYIVLFMICFTYIAVKFMGMFSMKLNM